jgi:UDP-N-acetylglucosamine transferase subunit ALG13
MDFSEMLEHFRAADAVVTHAGVGSILCARREGHVPVVVPRSRRQGEHVDDHQAQLTRALEERGVVIAAWETDNLAEAVRSAGKSSPPPATAPRTFHEVVRQALLR